MLQLQRMVSKEARMTQSLTFKRQER